MLNISKCSRKMETNLITHENVVCLLNDDEGIRRAYIYDQSPERCFDNFEINTEKDDHMARATTNRSTVVHFFKLVPVTQQDNTIN
uniref:Uncharacterized protein n=1 Tax=Romanomermis culicivorax TaxID=13658 RepID=A0A915I7B4_ROMCU